MLKKFLLGKINGTKNVLFFPSRGQSHHSFILICNSYELKHKVRLSKTLCGIFHFWFRFALIKAYTFCSQKCMEFFNSKRDNPFQN